MHDFRKSTHWRPMLNRAAALLLFFAVVGRAQISTKLQPETIAAFDAYATRVEQDLQQRWTGKQPLFAIDSDPALRTKVFKGDVPVRNEVPDNPIEIPDGLVHDWTGDIFVPNTSVDRVLAVLRDFNRHASIYPDLTRSRVIRANGNDVTGTWRIEKKVGLLFLAMDIVDETHYRQIGPGTWICKAYAKDVRELDDPDTPHERAHPIGEGYGFLWRMYAYWTIHAVNGGVLAECRTVSLSRDIPTGVGWAVKPYIRKQPKESLLSTLEGTRKAAEQ